MASIAPGGVWRGIEIVDGLGLGVPALLEAWMC